MVKKIVGDRHSVGVGIAARRAAREVGLKTGVGLMCDAIKEAGITLLLIFPSDEKADVNNQIERMCKEQGKRCERCEMRLDPDGGYHWIDDRYEPLAIYDWFKEYDVINVAGSQHNPKSYEEAVTAWFLGIIKYAQESVECDAEEAQVK